MYEVDNGLDGAPVEPKKTGLEGFDLGHIIPPRKDDPGCGNCVFAISAKAGDGKSILQCQRFPPSWQLLVVPPTVLGGQAGITKQSSFPTTNKNNWCGEHKERPGDPS